MSQKLYVDSITRDWSMATTFITESISYDLVLLNPFNETFSPVFSVGKYVVIYFIHQDAWSHNLMFMDKRRNPDLIQELKNVPLK